MTREIQPGDVVRLKSGGPPMTVRNHPCFMAGVVGDDWICEWFTDSGERKSVAFQPHSLVLSESA